LRAGKRPAVMPTHPLNAIATSIAFSARTWVGDWPGGRDEAALDKYSFTRDAWLQRRRNYVFDGRPPKDAEDE